ncbi:acyl-CoA dehydrogenase family protein [Nocardia wallacei]|uniref:acyl-CoA dehydrogenase family protein n=1 Tax=Nocardia wallacei TaxID=480035 RepID=UPI00245617EB|nr:acyl-CoA dehydrogenase family protein [Nocardia wallacei]
MEWVLAAETFAAEVLEPVAAEVDRTGRIPATHFDALAERGFYGFALSEGMRPDVLMETAATIIGGCLATGFVWAQHLGALRAVAFADNAALRERYLEPMRAGKFRCGVSYAGARSNPTLFAAPAGSGYVLTGTAPFVTGWGYVDAVATSVRLRSEDAESIATLLVPARDLDGVTAEPLPLIAADASATVRLSFGETFVERAQLIGVKSAGEFTASRGSLSGWVNGALSLGVLSRCVRQLAELGAESAAHAARYAHLRTRFAAAAGDNRAVHALRADIARAAVETAAAGVVAAGSPATIAGSTPERLMRQATFALVCTTRDPIKQALLTRLDPAPSPD